MNAISVGSDLVLPFLGMLLERPRSAQDLLGNLGAGSRFEHLTPDAAAVDALILSLVEAGWLVRVAPTGPEPGDALCAISPAGREELKRRLGDALVDISWTSGDRFVTALPYLQLFDRDEAVALLDQRATALRQRSRDVQALSQAKNRTATEAAKDDYLAARTAAEIDWIEDYRDRVAALPWPPVEQVTPEPAYAPGVD